MTKPIRTPNNRAREFVQKCIPFQGSNMFGDWHTDHLGGAKRFVVHSYAAHFPMYIFDPFTNTWFGNKDKYSRSTTRHQSQALPTYNRDAITWLTTEGMQEIKHKGTIALFQKPVE